MPRLDATCGWISIPGSKNLTFNLHSALRVPHVAHGLLGFYANLHFTCTECLPRKRSALLAISPQLFFFHH
jgi:hypothetical protein